MRREAAEELAPIDIIDPRTSTSALMPAAARLPDLSALTLLVIARDDLVREGLTLYFKACGAAVLATRNVGRARFLIDTSAMIDLVIFDLASPPSMRRELVDKLRRKHPSPFQLRAIALTSQHDEQIDTAGFDAFIAKPLEFAEVCKVA